MAEPLYENVPKRQVGLSESVVILENLEDAEDAELNRGMTNLTLVASPTIQIMNQDNQVMDIQYEHVEEIRSTKNKNMLQLTSKNQTYFIRFNSRESLTHWLEVFKTTLHVSGISRKRPSTERHVRDKKYEETHRNRLSVQYVQYEWPRTEGQIHKRDSRTYDEPARQDKREDWKAIRCTPNNDLSPIKETPHCNVFINQMQGDFIFKKEASPSSKTAPSGRYQDLRPQPTYNYEYEHMPTSYEGMRSCGPKEGLFYSREIQNNAIVEDQSVKEDYEPLSQTAPSAVACRYNKLAEEHKIRYRKGMSDLLKKKVDRDDGWKRKFTSVDSNVFVSSTPEGDKCLYVGDRIHAINGIEVAGDASFTEKLIQSSTSKTVEITLSRLPRAEIGLIKRYYNDQPIGITFKGTKISSVAKGSAFAEKFGYNTHRCITHINGIYFVPGTSEKTMYKKLGESASEFFLVVQPTCFIEKLTKRQLKT